MYSSISLSLSRVTNNSNCKMKQVVRFTDPPFIPPPLALAPALDLDLAVCMYVCMFSSARVLVLLVLFMQVCGNG